LLAVAELLIAVGLVSAISAPGEPPRSKVDAVATAFNNCMKRAQG